MSDAGGIWRTVGGRKVFIKDGDDLATAMKKSGKFENKKEDQHKTNEFKEDIKSYDKEIAKRKAEIEKVDNGEGIYATMPENAKEIVRTNAIRSIAEYEIYKEYAKNGYQENGRTISVDEMMQKAKEISLSQVNEDYRSAERKWANAKTTEEKIQWNKEADRLSNLREKVNDREEAQIRENTAIAKEYEEYKKKHPKTDLTLKDYKKIKQGGVGSYKTSDWY